MNDLVSILQRLDSIQESKITPVGVKSGLNKQQTGVKQLPALFKPNKISPVLGAKGDKAHPTKGYFVGSESAMNEAQATEDVISNVKKKLGDYLADIAQQIKTDPDLKDKVPQDIDQIKAAVKTVTTDDGHEIKIHGNEDDGFRISIKNKEAKSKFDTLDEAIMACEMYCSRRRIQEQSKDYLEEK